VPGLRFHTVSRWPASMKLQAMAAPIWPGPTMPISMLISF
jgi:hypothetical protein